jgi:subtilase family serine protease
MLPLQKVFPCLVALALLAGTPAIAQKGASNARIVDQIDDNQLVTLRGNTHPAANAQNDRGRVSPQLQMSDLLLVLRRSPEQQAAFDAFVASQYDPTSSNYHHWLEPAQIGAKFGPSLADIATISNWLTAHSLSVDEISNDRMTIRFSGTAGRVQSAFHTEIHNLSVKGEDHLANMSDPQIPMALDPVVAGVKALHNFFPKPLHRLGGKATLNSETGKWQRVTGSETATGSNLQANATGIHPELGVIVGSGTTNVQAFEDVTPYDFAAIYNILPLWNASIDGTGQTIAIVGTSDIRASDVAAFRNTFGLPAGPAFQTKVANGTDPGICNASASSTTANCTINDQTENALDVELAGAIAKNAQIVLVVSGTNAQTTDTVYSSANYIVQNNVAKIMNVSYGLCELGLGAAGNASYNNLWQSAAAAGIAVFAAAGDSGSPGCDPNPTPASAPYAAQFGFSVSGVASSQYATAVGGTDFTWCNPTASSICPSGGPHWGTTNNSSTGANAQGYIPEIPWNDSCASPPAVAYLESLAAANKISGVTDAESACNFAANNNSLLLFVYPQGTGGGASNCINGDRSSVSSCTQGYPKPSWQAGVTGIPNDAARDIPDVSFFAAAGLYHSAYLICVSDLGACLTTTSPTTEPFAQEIGGTSAATPAMAGVMALINQKAGATQGNPNAELYDLASKQTYSSCKSETGTTSNGCYFNDIDAGTNAIPCMPGSPNCTVLHTGDALGILSGYSGMTGFDLATGLGTMNVANVVNGWGTATGSAVASVTVAASPATITTSQSTNVTVTVTGSSGTPTGTVVIKSGSFASSTKTLTSGSATFSIAGTSLAAGAVTLSANYSGDSTYSSATGSTTVNTSTFSLSATSPSNISRGSAATSTVTVNTTNNYSGTVTLTCTLTNGPANSAVDTPTCTASSGAISPGGTGTASVGTMAATKAALERPMLPGKSRGLIDGGAVLALLVMLGIPARRRSWRAMLGVLVLMIAVGSLAACGGGSSGSGGGATPDPGTASGTYTFTVTGAGTPSQASGNTTTFTVTVN